MLRFRIFPKSTGDVRSVQTVARELRLVIKPDSNAGKLFALAGETPAFDKKNFAICFPPFGQIEGKGELRRGGKFDRGFARAMKQFPNRLHDFPRGRALDLFQEQIASLELCSRIRASNSLVTRFPRDR